MMKNHPRPDRASSSQTVSIKQASILLHFICRTLLPLVLKSLIISIASISIVNVNEPEFNAIYVCPCEEKFLDMSMDMVTYICIKKALYMHWEE